MSQLTEPTQPAPASPRGRLIRAAEHVAGRPASAEVRGVPLTDPTALAGALTADLGALVVVTGTMDRRLVLIEHADAGTWTAADLSGEPHGTRDWPSWTRGRLVIDRPSDWLSSAWVTADGLRRLQHPRVLLTALYHPEHFPLPRFPLGISDLARAARGTLLGQVELMDMQLGANLDDLLGRIGRTRPDIVGISATFGQHDLMTRLLDEVCDPDGGPLVVAGGSLTARNERLLLDRYPDLLIGRGAGEPVVADLLGYWHGDLDLDQVRGIGYRGAARGEGTLTIGRPRHTASVANRAQTDMWPELDLLPRTFACGGVAQLEASRGCTNFCSFCPRGHKGTWAGAAPEALGWVLDAMAGVFDAHPQVSRTLYLVDEEFIGRGPDASDRALAVAAELHARGLAWETSCRVDQVIRPGCDRDWHIARGGMWRELVARGLRRCLFGVESGVTSILERFNKETTGEQNALAIRALSALGVPTRFTYITFDHLMTPAELHASHAFQGRTDLILRPLPHLDPACIMDGIHDEQFVAGHATGQPFHEAITYMLGSMECLTGAAYTRAVKAAGLAGAARPSMGRIDARYADWRIGVLSNWAQLWIDRNHALDYTLKSLEKIADGARRDSIRGARAVFKRADYTLLTGMLGLLDTTDLAGADEAAMSARCRALADTTADRLRGALDEVVPRLTALVPGEQAAVLSREHVRWNRARSWLLINAADPCGT